MSLKLTVVEVKYNIPYKYRLKFLGHTQLNGSWLKNFPYIFPTPLYVTFYFYNCTYITPFLRSSFISEITKTNHLYFNTRKFMAKSVIPEIVLKFFNYSLKNHVHNHSKCTGRLLCAFLQHFCIIRINNSRQSTTNVYSLRLTHVK